MKNMAGPIGAHGRTCPLRRDGSLAAVLAVLIAFAAGCGSGPSQQSQRLGLVLSRCMRAHGIGDFPDGTVTVSNGDIHLSVSSGSLAYFRSPTVRAGLRECQGVVDRADAGGKNGG